MNRRTPSPERRLRPAPRTVRGRSLAALLTLAGLVALMLLPTPAHAAGPNPVGIVIAADGGIVIERAAGGSEPARKGLRLFPADVLVKPATAATPEVKWWPYAGWKDDTAAERLVVAFTPPGSGPRPGMLDRLKNFMGFVDTEYEQIHGVADRPMEMTRLETEMPELEKSTAHKNGESKPDQSQAEPAEAAQESLESTQDKNSFESGAPLREKGSTSDIMPVPQAGGAAAPSGPADPAAPPAPDSGARHPTRPQKPLPAQPRPDRPRPGNGATVLRGILITFSGGEDAAPAGRRLLVCDGQGAEVFAREATGPLLLKPEEMGLRQNATYTWRFAGEPTTAARTFRLVSAPAEKGIREDFARMARETSDPTELRIRRAAYLQMVSDLSPGEIDLYWLSERLLREVQRDRPDHPAATRFLARYHDHQERTNP